MGIAESWGTTGFHVKNRNSQSKRTDRYTVPHTLMSRNMILIVKTTARSLAIMQRIRGFVLIVDQPDTTPELAQCATEISLGLKS